MAANKFLLVENFTWLINRLMAFPGGYANGTQFTHKKMPNIKGGPRRELRKTRHFPTEYTVTHLGKQIVKFGSTPIECDKWKVTHNDFKDPGMGEKFPAPPDGGHTVMITSVDSMANQTAPRYYVSCSCMDFDTTFLQKLVDAGYTNDPGNIKPASTGPGAKKLDSAICKHIYAVIVDQYQKSVALEKGVEVANAAIMPWTGSSVPAPIPPTQSVTAQPQVPTRDKKTEYSKLIAATLKRLSNSSSNSINAYKSPNDAAKHYRKYKFMVKWYGKSWAIVFTNPALNPFPPDPNDKNQFKEMVPIYIRTSTGMKPSPYSPLSVYSYFTKDELKDLIRTNSKEIQQPQIARLKSILGIKPTTPDSSWLTESLEVEVSIMNSLLETL
jgi:hypothetical protein